MKIHQEFTMARPIDTVWAYFQDVPRVAASLPGAEYLGEKDGKHLGKVTTKVGPFSASFEGEAIILYDEAEKSVQMEGKGVDKKGASRGKMVMACRLSAVNTDTKIVVDSDVQLSGTVAQFGRTGLLTEIANILVADFVQNAEADMAVLTKGDTEDGNSADPTKQAKSQPSRGLSKPVSVVTLLLMSLKAWIRGWFKKSA